MLCVKDISGSTDLTGTDLKHYRIEPFIGQGHGRRLPRPGHPAQSSGGDQAPESRPGRQRRRRNRFVQEARGRGRLSHTAIAQVYDIGEVDGCLFIVMEYIDGRSVGRLIADRELDLLSSVEIAFQVVEGLKSPRGRDPSPGHQVGQHHGHARQAELAWRLRAGQADGTGSGRIRSAVDPLRTLTKDAGRTLPGLVIGTVPYMSGAGPGAGPRRPERLVFSRRRSL